MRKTIILIVLGFLISCKKTKTENPTICKMIIQLSEDDQKYRGDKRIIDPFFGILDSILKAENIGKDEYSTFTIETQLEYGRKARSIANKRPIDTLLVDSLMKLQKEIDYKNTRKLITYTKKNGYPSKKCTGCKKSPDLIFLHSPEKFSKELKQLVKEEFKLGNINETQAAFWLRHIEGRKDNNLNNILKKNKITKDKEAISKISIESIN